MMLLQSGGTSPKILKVFKNYEFYEDASAFYKSESGNYGNYNMA